MLDINQLRKDIDDVMVVERLCFHDPWERSAFERETTNTFSRSLLARDAEGRLVGYFIWWVAGPEYHILNVAVHPAARRAGGPTWGPIFFSNIFLFNNTIHGAPNVFWTPKTDFGPTEAPRRGPFGPKMP